LTFQGLEASPSGPGPGDVGGDPGAPGGKARDATTHDGERTVSSPRGGPGAPAADPPGRPLPGRGHGRGGRSLPAAGERPLLPLLRLRHREEAAGTGRRAMRRGAPRRGRRDRADPPREGAHRGARPKGRRGRRLRAPGLRGARPGLRDALAPLLAGRRAPAASQALPRGGLDLEWISEATSGADPRRAWDRRSPRPAPASPAPLSGGQPGCRAPPRAARGAPQCGSRSRRGGDAG